MTLGDVLKAMASNTSLDITLIDSEDSSLIKFNAAGYASVESDLQEREVKKIKVESASTVKITVGDAVEPPTP